MDKNKKLHELLGLCWHEFKMSSHCHIDCTCGECFSGYRSREELEEHCKEHNPDYATDPRLVLREMEKREDWEQFAYRYFSKGMKTKTREVVYSVPVAMGERKWSREQCVAYLYLKRQQEREEAEKRLEKHIDFILDTTGKLRDLAIEFLTRAVRESGEA